MSVSSPARCVLIQPAGGLFFWQRACMDYLSGDTDVVIAGIVTTGATDDGARLATRWLDGLTRPRSARRRLPWSAAQNIAQRTAGDALVGADIEWAVACRPDFVLVFDVAIAPGLLQHLPAVSVWQFSEGGHLPGDAAPPALAALARGDNRLTLSLWSRRYDQRSPALIARGHTPAVAHSRKRSLARLYEIAPDLLRRGVADRLVGQEPALNSPADPIDPPTPANWPGLIAALGLASMRRWREKLWLRQRWDIGLISGRILLPDADQIAAAHWLSGPPAGFWADPCLVADTHEPVVLVEAYRDETGRGEITALSWPGDPTETAPTARATLQLDAHLSFPRAYSHAGERWLVPEMAACGAQRAYRLDSRGQCVDTPPMTVTGLAGIDPVLFARDGAYWAFVSPSGRRANYQLDLYMADDFFGPYRRHPASPVRIDPHGGRCAGPVIRDGARLLRFGQVFGRHYGEAIDVFEITTLTSRHYAERRIGRLGPAPSTGSGMHSIDFSERLTVVDRFRLEPVWRILWRRLLGTRRG